MRGRRKAGPTRDEISRIAAACPEIRAAILDRELERRGHCFVRYADDCNVYVCSEAAGRRVKASIRRFIERRLKLQVSAEKSAVAHPWQRSLLGFTLTEESAPRRRIARFKDRCGH